MDLPVGGCRYCLADAAGLDLSAKWLFWWAHFYLVGVMYATHLEGVPVINSMAGAILRSC